MFRVLRLSWERDSSIYKTWGLRICDSPSVNELVASTLRSYGNNTMRKRGVDIAILGVDIAILGVDIAILDVDIVILGVDVAVLGVDIVILGVDIAILGVDIEVVGAVVPRGCVAARAVETTEVAGAIGCVAVETTKSQGWPKPGAASQRGRQKSRGWP